MQEWDKLDLLGDAWTSGGVYMAWHGRGEEVRFSVCCVVCFYPRMLGKQQHVGSGEQASSGGN